MTKQYVCENCSHTFVPPAFEDKVGPHCPRCKSMKIREETASPKSEVH